MIKRLGPVLVVFSLVVVGGVALFMGSGKSLKYKSGAASAPSPTPACRKITKTVTDCRQASNCGGGKQGGLCGGVDKYGVAKRYCTYTVTNIVCPDPMPTPNRPPTPSITPI